MTFRNYLKRIGALRQKVNQRRPFDPAAIGLAKGV